MSHVLDRPAWSALAGPHAEFAEGGPLARRYRPDIIPFAASRDATPESLTALADLAKSGEEMGLMEAMPPVIPPGFETVVAAPGFQMVLASPPAPASDPRIVALGPADAAEMLALATLTRPGPFTLRAQALGTFYGIRVDGRLAAMAGERLKPPGFAEVSGVCSHPDFRGRGFARMLSIHVLHRVLARGETPFLHGWAANTAAIKLYESIGFAHRADMHVALIRRV